MTPNPLTGVLFHWLGGLASASFYVPYKRIRGWSWEIFWLTGGFFSWVIAPWLFASIQTNNLWEVLSSTPTNVLLWCYFWGAMWGLGGLAFGLTMRYLGLSLGMAVALGLTTVIGTMGPPLFRGTVGTLASTLSGKIIFVGIAVVLLGIIIIALAGHAKEKQIKEKQLNSSDTDRGEFNLKKGIAIAIFSGVMSSCFAFGLDAGESIRAASLLQGTSPSWKGLPVLCVILAGGFTTNLLWCSYLIWSNKSAQQFFKTNLPATSLRINYFFAALGGTLWYFQFFFYTLGESQMGRFGFSSWTLHMASIILFSTLWGFALSEWKGTTRNTKLLVWLGILTLVSSTVLIGWGNAQAV
ncbi:L-rhamnose-proton symporter [Cellvibrio zantedeschiae]|uniref:L-rhamnose-proton symporter n=1 Tax=Cellvibrio zantedeschiae TaxID=1237077 RepID=A0ABQ3BBM7_9GAMM|nr:L-rhamnose/proton symporter RhaT [Cellvibrio zantedeschiae]GGY84698.1 L-rhamnose-proton symporter [Cellvibrio zantedeschiae]